MSGSQPSKDRYHTKAGMWIMRLPERRGDALDAGCKVVLQAHWNAVDFEVERDATARECYVSAEYVAAEIGSSEAAVVDRRRKLIAAGWIRREGRGWALAWREPFATRTQDDRDSSLTCDPSLGDPSHPEPRPESTRTATLVTAKCDPSTTNQSLTNPLPTSDQYQSNATERDPLTESQTDEPSTQHPSSPEPQADDRDRTRGDRRHVRASGGSQAAANTGVDAGRRGGPPASVGQGQAGALAPEPLTLVGIVEADRVVVTRDVARELLEEHDRLRRAALEYHGLKVTSLRRPNTKAEGETLKHIRERLAEHGEADCRHVLAVLSWEWQRSLAQTRDWSHRDTPWIAKNFEGLRHRCVGSTGGRVEPAAASKPRRFEDAAVWTGEPSPQNKPAKPRPEPMPTPSPPREIVEDWG